MTGSEFIEKLKKALENDLSEAQVREQTAFYSSYIREEVRKGRSEEEVTGELGDPWASPGISSAGWSSKMRAAGISTRQNKAARDPGIRTGI